MTPMQTQRLLTLFFACSCLFAAGSMAGSLETTVSGSPAEVIDLDRASLPLPSDRVSELLTAYHGQGAPGESMGLDADGGETTGGTGTALSDPVASSRPGDTPSRWQRLVGYLVQALIGAAAALIVYTSRESIQARLQALLQSETDRGSQSHEPSGEIPPPAGPPPDNEIERLWLEMVSRADQAGDRSSTPRERARRRVDAGLNGQAVGELTGLYEAVRFGEQPVTERLVEKARAAYRRSSEGRDG